MASIKELKELLDAVDAITITAFDAFADGFQFDDLTKFMPIFSKVRNAIEGISLVRSEIQDLYVEELKELTSWAIDFVFNILKKSRELAPVVEEKKEE